MVAFVAFLNFHISFSPTTSVHVVGRLKAVILRREAVKRLKMENEI